MSVSIRAATCAALVGLFLMPALARATNGGAIHRDGPAGDTTGGCANCANGSVQNVTTAQYLASGYTTTTFESSTVNNTAIPPLGMPLMAVVGLRVRF